MKKIFLLLTLSLMLLLVACGGGDEVSEAIPVSYTYRLTNEFIYDPASITIPADTPVTINLDNANAALSHSWLLVPAGSVADDATPEEIEAAAIAGTNSGEIVAGESGTVEFTAPEAGAYEFICSVAGHLAGGMKGKLTVIN